MSQHPSPERLRQWSEGRLTAADSQQIAAHLETCPDVCLTALDKISSQSGLPTLQPGARPLPEYQLVQKLGEGGFGEVWRASGPGGLDVALKFVRLAAALEMRALDLMKSIRHPNLVSLFGAWKKQNMLILAMELCDRSLLDRLNEALGQGQSGIPLKELLNYMRDAANGLDALNEQNVQHRDVKPANLLLVSKGVKVADFGLAKVLESTMASHTGAMTPAYSTPEFFRGQVSMQSDQYSLAMTYYHLRTGNLLFSGSLERIMYCHLNETPNLTALPQSEHAVLARALAKAPEERWQTCGTFADELIKAGSLATPQRKAAIAKAPVDAKEHQEKSQQRQVLFQGHSEKIISVAFSPDGKQVLTGSHDKTARLWDAASGQEIRCFQDPVAQIWSTAFSPDGQKVMTGGSDGTARLWDAASGQEICSFRGHFEEIASVAFSPDGRHVLTGSSDRTARLWDAASGQEIRSFQGHSESISSVTFSPDGRQVLTGSSDRTARLWDAASGREIRSFRHSRMISSVAFSPASKHVLTGSWDTTARLWDAASGREIRCFQGHLEWISAVAFSPDGTHVLTASSDTTARLWHVPTGQEVRCFRGLFSAVAFSPDGRQVLTGGPDKTARLWNIGEQKCSAVIGEANFRGGVQQPTNPSETQLLRKELVDKFQGNDDLQRYLALRTTDHVRQRYLALRTTEEKAMDQHTFPWVVLWLSLLVLWNVAAICVGWALADSAEFWLSRTVAGGTCAALISLSFFLLMCSTRSLRGEGWASLLQIAAGTAVIGFLSGGLVGGIAFSYFGAVIAISLAATTPGIFIVPLIITALRDSGGSIFGFFRCAPYRPWSAAQLLGTGVASGLGGALTGSHFIVILSVVCFVGLLFFALLKRAAWLRGKYGPLPWYAVTLPDSWAFPS